MELYIQVYQDYPVVWFVGIPVFTLFVLAGAQQAKWGKLVSFIQVLLGLISVISMYDKSPGEVVSHSPVGTERYAIIMFMIGICLVLGGTISFFYGVCKRRWNAKRK